MKFKKKSEIFFSIEEISRYKDDLPETQIHILDGGHDVLDTHFDTVLTLIRDFIKEKSA